MADQTTTPTETFILKDTTTLAEIKAHIAANSKKGVRCPCCNGMVKLYRRTINVSNAICLTEMFKISQKEGFKFYHITEMMEKSKKMALRLNGGEFARMRHWGFIEEMPKASMDTHKKTSGYWRMTETGKAFCQNHLKVQKAILLLNNIPLGFDGEDVNISECFDESFDYQSVMAETVITNPKGQTVLPM